MKSHDFRHGHRKTYLTHKELRRRKMLSKLVGKSYILETDGKIKGQCQACLKETSLTKIRKNDLCAFCGELEVNHRPNQPFVPHYDFYCENCLPKI